MNVSIKTEIAGGAFWHPNYDPFDPITYEDSHDITPESLFEIVEDGKTGLLHRKDDAEHLAERLKEAITDSELREKIGKQAREWVCETHSWDVISSRVTEVYNRLLEDKK